MGLLPDGVADGLGGGLRTSVGVGTGGMVSTGTGEEPAEPVGEGAAEMSDALGAGAVWGVEAVAPRRGGWEEYWTGVTGWDVTTRSGAVPMPPAPPWALATGGFPAGVPSSQPMVMAKGRPKATMPKNTYLGESRTQLTPFETAQRLRCRAVGLPEALAVREIA